jgi:hypothetical protein
MALGFWEQSGSATTIVITWIRDRVYPPSGVMPSMNFGSIIANPI